MAQSIFITVADPSADENAALLSAELKRLRSSLRLRGVGGNAMKRAGVTLLTDTVSNAAMGVSAVGRVAEVSRLLARVRIEVEKDKPSLFICVDSWSMNVHFARLAKSLGIPVLYYVAPQTWASREGRVKRMREVISHLACILPFEERYFRSFGIPTTFVGHPLWDRISPPPPSSIPSSSLTSPVVAILPGSRKGVTRSNWPRLIEVMRQIKAAIPAVTFRVPVTPNARATLGNTPPFEGVTFGDIDDLLPGCDLAVCVSGTAALHVAAYGVPLIVVYYGNPLLWHLLGRWVIRTRTYSLVNLLSGPPDQITYGQHIVPEFIPWYGSTLPVAVHAIRLLRDPAKLARIRSDMQRVTSRLSAGGASRKTAELALSLLAPPSKA